MKNTTKALIRALGSPLLKDIQPDLESESAEILELAFRNNVELVYLNNLRAQGKLDTLAPQLETFEQRFRKTSECIVRIASTLDHLEIPYAITKSLRPYPAIPNDTDLLYLGPLSEYEEAIKKFENAGFTPHGGSRLQAQFFDPAGGEIFQRDKRGGMFYIDFYRQLAADHMPYMSSSKLAPFVTTVELNGYPVKVFRPIAESVILFLHSAIMHRSFPLEVFWSLAWWLSEMKEEQLLDFACFIRKNRALTASRTAFSIMAEIHMLAFGVVPEKVKRMQELTGHRNSEVRELQRHDYHFPHISKLSTFVFSVLGKTLEWNSFKGFSKQLLMMLNPLFFIEVFHHMLSRARIKQHGEHV